MNSNLLDFVTESFPIIKHISLNQAYSQKQIPAKFGKCLWEIFVFFFKIFASTNISVQMTFLYLCFLQKLYLESLDVEPSRTLNGAIYFSFPNTVKTGQ